LDSPVTGRGILPHCPASWECHAHDKGRPRQLILGGVCSLSRLRRADPFIDTRSASPGGQPRRGVLLCSTFPWCSCMALVMRAKWLKA